MGGTQLNEVLVYFLGAQSSIVLVRVVVGGTLCHLARGPWLVVTHRGGVLSVLHRLRKATFQDGLDIILFEGALVLVKEGASFLVHILDELLNTSLLF
jgi:hypothetical protein